MRFAIDESIKGEAISRQPGEVEMTMLIYGSGYGDQVLENVPDGRYLVFLINEAVDQARKGLPAEPGDPYRYWYRPVNSVQGVMREFDGLVVRGPAGSEGSSELLDEVDGTDFGALVARVGSIAARQG